MKDHLELKAYAKINLGLDVLLVAGFGMGTIGAAAATSVSQVFAAVICLWKLRSYPVFHLRREELRFDPPLFKEYAGLCLPMMAQSFVIAGGGTYVQACINQYGVDFAAGVSAAGKLFSVLETGAIGLASACASFVSPPVRAHPQYRAADHGSDPCCCAGAGHRPVAGRAVAAADLRDG